MQELCEVWENTVFKKGLGSQQVFLKKHIIKVHAFNMDTLLGSYYKVTVTVFSNMKLQLTLVLIVMCWLQTKASIQQTLKAKM